MWNARSEGFADSTLSRVSETTFYELRGGGPDGNRAAIILIDCDFAKPGRRPRPDM